jgi:hypothetical protein
LGLGGPQRKPRRGHPWYESALVGAGWVFCFLLE